MTNLTRKQLELLSLVLRNEPQSIYQLAKKASRPYRRVYDHVQRLVELGFVQLQEKQINNRRSLMVVPCDPCYHRLLHLDELYRAWRVLSPANQLQL